MICDFGDVAIVPFPFLESDLSKIRPALILSKIEFNEANGSTLLAMITTAKQSSWPSDLDISEIGPAGLKRPSYVRWKVFTLPNQLIDRVIGRLAADDLHAALQGLRQILP